MPPEYLAAILENRPSYRAKEKSVAINFRDLPEPMFRELVWCLHRTVGLGRTVHAEEWNRLTAHLERAIETEPGTVSLVEKSETSWMASFTSAQAKEGIVAPRRVEKRRKLLRQMLDLLLIAYHDGDWWELDVWNPLYDSRIPLRDHEPSGRHVVNFSHLTTPWLREATKWWLKTYLETGHYTWTSLKSRLDQLKWFQRHIDAEGACGPQIVQTPDALRPWCAAFVKRMRDHVVEMGPTQGQRLGVQQRRTAMTTIEAFYRFMFDNRVEASQVLCDRRWLEVGIQHCVLFRPNEKPRFTNRQTRDHVLSDQVVEQIAAGASLLGLPVEEGGMGDEQALRALLLLMRTGRRLNEILMLDFDPLEDLPRPLGNDQSGFVARLRYQQTKIFTDNPTILADTEIVTLIRAQQQWCLGYLQTLGNADPKPKYLFVRCHENRLGLHPYPMPTLHNQLASLSERLDLKDGNGRRIQISKTHDFRHTKATNLLNAGVPLHVVMRFLGHESANMTLHYAKTLDQTAEREFLRYKKITADGKLLEVDPRDLYDMLELDRRTDRILPNGVCLLPPRQVCTKGNACLTCTEFVTDETYRPELEDQLARTESLVEQRQSVFEQRHGQRMEESNVWLTGRLKEMVALHRIITTLDGVEKSSAVRGAGASALQKGGKHGGTKVAD